jgi:hypothetical protein
MFRQSTTQCLDTTLDMKMIADLAFSLAEVTLDAEERVKFY